MQTPLFFFPYRALEKEKNCRKPLVVSGNTQEIDVFGTVKQFPKSVLVIGNDFAPREVRCFYSTGWDRSFCTYIHGQ